MWTCPNPDCGSTNDDEFAECPFCGSLPQDDEQLCETEGSGTVRNAQPADWQVAVMRAAAPPQAEEADEPMLVLSDARTGKRIEVSFSPCILGREGDVEPDVFSARVSRIHLEAKRDRGHWTIRHVGQNPTIVFSRGARTTLTSAVAFPIEGGETLRIADMTFGVSVETPAVSQQETLSLGEALLGEEDDALQMVPSDGAASLPSNMVEGWFIDCPPGGCGRSFLVAGEDSALDECPHCVDVFDKRRIAHVRPVFGRRAEHVVVDLR